MKKILFVMPGDGSIPSVKKGGAVATLVEHLLEKNEKEKKYQISITSNYTKESYEASQKYFYSKFIYIKRKKIVVKFLGILSKILFKVNKKLWNKFNLNDLDYLVPINKILKKERYDVVILENRSKYINNLTNLRNEKVILHIHNDYLSKNDIRNKELANKYSKVWTVSNYIKENTYAPNCNKDNIKVFFNCIDTEFFNKNLYIEDRKKIREKYNIKDEDIVYVFSGRLDKIKGVRELIEAFSMLEYKNVKLLILGAYDYGKKNKNDFVINLEKMVSKIQDKVVFTGFIDRNDIPKFLGATDIAIVPSIWEDPCPLTVFEAQASGLPLITTNKGGIPEIVDKNIVEVLEVDNNFTLSLKEKMEFLYLNPQERKKRGAAGREHVKKYNLDYYWEQFEELIENE